MTSTHEMVKVAPEVQAANQWLDHRMEEAGALDDPQRYVEWYAESAAELDHAATVVEARYKAVKERLRVRRNTLDLRHAEPVAEAARKLIAAQKGRGKFIDTVFGRIGFRKGKGGVVTVKDDGEALLWAAEHAPECVEFVPATTRLKKTGLAEAIDRYAQAHGGEVPEFFEVSDGSEERMYVKTEVGDE